MLHSRFEKHKLKEFMETNPKAPLGAEQHRKRLQESQVRLKSASTAMQTAQWALAACSNIQENPSGPLPAKEIEAGAGLKQSDVP